MCVTTTPHKDRDNVYSPALPPILPEVLPYVIAGFVGMNILYSVLVSADLPSLLGLPPPAAAYCDQDDKNCSRPDLLAFAVISGLTFLVCGGIGIYSWHVTGRAKQESPELRLYGYLPEAKWLTVVNLTYQIWDFYISLVSIPDFCTPIMMTHHTVAGIVAYSGLSSQILSTYAIFFMGLSEVSSIFLVGCDLGQFFPPVPGTMYDTWVNGISAPLFVITFLYYRVVLWWWPMSYNLFQDVRTVLQNGVAEQRGRKWVLYQLVFLTVPMGFLQLYWTTLILVKVKSMIMPE
jgi:hypothetical protein